MKTSQLFGIQFARKYKYKAQIIADFKRWKRERQYFLADEQNKHNLLERLLRKYKESHPMDSRTYEDIACELWENIKVQVARTNWQHVYEAVLGEDVQSPNYQLGPHISRKDTKELFRDYNCKHYYLTDNAVLECEKVRIAEPNMDSLMEADDGKRQLNWGDKFIRYEKKGSKIVAIAASFTRRQECKYLQHTFFVLDLNTSTRPFDSIAEIVKKQCETDLHDSQSEFERKMKLLLCRMIIFLDLLPLKQITLPGWGILGKGAVLSNQTNHIDPVYNNENVEITVVTVNANWNCSVLIEDKWVIKHKRHYLCGKGRTKIIAKDVQRHFRRGYERLAGKLKFGSSKDIANSCKVVMLQQKAAIGTANVDVTRKPIYIAMNDQPRSVGEQRGWVCRDVKHRVRGANGQPKNQAPLHPFYAKLEELKKKFNG